MGKQIVVTCDSCGKDVFSKIYYTIKPRKYNGGKGQLYPSIWLCPECFRKTKLGLLLLDIEEKERSYGHEE